MNKHTEQDIVNSQQPIPTEALHDKANYSISSLDEEIRADLHCADLLKKFHRHLLQELQTDPLEAGILAAGADYFLREFIIGGCRENILEVSAERINQFGGNWYIIRNLEPNRDELNDMLQGTAAFYEYCAACDLVPEVEAVKISAECARIEDFARRIEEFHDISGDGFKNWDRGCPLD